MKKLLTFVAAALFMVNASAADFYDVKKGSADVGASKSVTSVDGITLTFDSNSWSAAGSSSAAETVDGIAITQGYATAGENASAVSFTTTAAGTLTIYVGGNITANEKLIRMEDENNNGLTGIVIGTEEQIVSGNASTQGISQYDGISYTLAANKTYTFLITGTKWRFSAFRYVLAPSTDPVITAADASISVKESGVAATQQITIEGKNLTGTELTATLSPAVNGLSVLLESTTISNGSIKTTATLSYTATENANGTTTLILSDGETSQEVKVTYIAAIADYTLQKVTDAATWDWSKFGTNEIKLEDNTTPQKGNSFVLANIVRYDWCNSINEGFGNAQQLEVSAEYVVRDGQFFQGASIKFNTLVPGTLAVTYSNTGNRTNEDERRFLNVNGKNYGEGTMESRSTMTTSDIPVGIGEVMIKGVFSDGSEQYLRIFKIEFTPSVVVIPAIVSETGFASFSSDKALDFTDVEGLEAYVISEVTATSATLTQVKKVPAGTGLILKGTAGEAYTVDILDGDADTFTNELEAAVNGTTVSENSVYVVYEGALHPFSGTEIPAGKAYLQMPAGGARVLPLVFGEATGINAVQSSKGDNAIYDLSGRRVEKLSKGIFVVNGQKIVVK